MDKSKKILEIRGLSISFRQYERGLRQRTIETIRNLDVTVHEGELVAIVGASGSGKSLLAHAVTGILPYNSSTKGEMYFCQEKLDQKRIEALRGKEIVLVPQSTSYLDPLMQVGRQVRKSKKDDASKKKTTRLLEEFRLDPSVEKLYPFELSGGMARRILISTAAIEQPKLVIADEPTPGLHMEVAKQVMSHFRDLADQGAGVLVITHDLELARETVDRIIVFYEGKSIEDVDASAFWNPEQLQHPFSKALVDAIPGKRK